MSLRSLAAVAGAFLAISALFLWNSVTSSPSPRKDSGPSVVAHRGASAYAPENTLAALDKAGELGVAWVETDVQRTLDGELVAMHDTTLERTTDVENVFPDRSPWRVADFTAAEIGHLDAGSWFGAEYVGTRVPTLEEYLRHVEDNGQKLLLELKQPDLYPGLERQALDELAESGWLDRSHTTKRLVVQSFDADSVRIVHNLAPRVRTGVLGAPSAADLPDYARFADQVNPGWKTADAQWVAAAHGVDGAHGDPLEVFVWTVDDAATARRMAERGVDGIISNRPDVVLEAVRDGAGPVLTGPTADGSQ